MIDLFYHILALCKKNGTNDQRASHVKQASIIIKCICLCIQKRRRKGKKTK